MTLVVADGLGDDERDGVRIVDVGKSNGRLDRMLGATRRVLKRAVALDAELYHMHDPELLPVGLELKRRGKRVVFDAHEDLPAQIMSKSYINAGLRKPLSRAALIVERFACGRLDAVVGATPTIRDKFRDMNIRSVDINNFPLLGELDADEDNGNKAREVCYIGGIGTSRGMREIVAAMARCKSGTRLNLAGNYFEKDGRASLVKDPGWEHVNELGYLSRADVKSVLGRSIAGIVTLHPTRAYLDSLPVKMFEYMIAGLPVIASDFPLWREIINGCDCGVCVDPLNPQAIAEAIDRLVENPEEARRKGEKGRRAVLDRYNWSAEERKLLDFYKALF